MFDSLVYIDCCWFYLFIYIARSLSSKDLLYVDRWNPFSFFPYRKYDDFIRIQFILYPNEEIKSNLKSNYFKTLI